MDVLAKAPEAAVEAFFARYAGDLEKAAVSVVLSEILAPATNDVDYAMLWEELKAAAAEGRYAFLAAQLDPQAVYAGHAIEGLLVEECFYLFRETGAERSARFPWWVNWATHTSMARPRSALGYEMIHAQSAGRRRSRAARPSAK